MSKISLKHSGGNVVSLNSPTSAPTSADVAFKLPNQDGSANEVLKTDGSGNLSFGAVTDTNDYVKLLDVSGSNLGAKVVIDNLDTTTYKYFDFVGTLQPTNDSSYLLMRYRTGGASGADYATSDYNSGINYIVPNSSGYFFTAASAAEWAISTEVGNHASEAISITMRIGMAESGDPTPMQWFRNFATWGGSYRDHANAVRHISGAGHVYNTSVVPTGFTFFFNGGNGHVAAYDYSVYGIKR